MKYTVCEWHGPYISGEYTIEDIMLMAYRWVKFDKQNGVAWVSNCCSFILH